MGACSVRGVCVWVNKWELPFIRLFTQLSLVFHGSLLRHNNFKPNKFIAHLCLCLDIIALAL
jgi:hypothetical protein